jgi:hypothetical protein
MVFSLFGRTRSPGSSISRAFCALCPWIKVTGGRELKGRQPLELLSTQLIAPLADIALDEEHKVRTMPIIA